MVKIASDCAVICDEEGRLKGKEHCCKIAGVDFVGTVVLCGVSGDEFADLPIGWDGMKTLFPRLWKV